MKSGIIRKYKLDLPPISIIRAVNVGAQSIQTISESQNIANRLNLICSWKTVQILRYDQF